MNKLKHLNVFLPFCSVLKLAAIGEKKKYGVGWFCTSERQGERVRERETHAQGLCKAEAVNQGLAEWAETRQ